jgi:hypothetical protein
MQAMGHSILIVNGRHAPFEDIDLLVVASLAVAAMKEQERLFPVAAAWDAAIHDHAPGVVDLPLQPFVGDPDARTALVTVLAGLERELCELGVAVPIVSLRARCKIPGVSFEAPYPTQPLVAAALRLRDLIESAQAPGDPEVAGSDPEG